MNPEQIHDALTLLPSDLITAVDKLRSRPRKPRHHWARWASLAACLAVLLYGGFLFRNHFLSQGGSSKASVEMAPQAPAAAAPAADVTGETYAAADIDEAEAAIEETPAEEVPAADTSHSHSYAKERSTGASASGYCGNTMATVYIGGEAHTLSGSDAIAITEILIHLDYDPDAVCRCAAEYAVDTELLTDIEVNLTEAFARCDQGQAALTEQQTETIREIIDTLG